MNTETLILANLTKRDFAAFHHHGVPYSGAAADPHFNPDPKPWGKDAPYIASFLGELLRAVKAMKWKRFSVEVTDRQWLVRRLREKRSKRK